MTFRDFLQQTNFQFPTTQPLSGFIIYFLIHRGEIVYVGKSSALSFYGRIGHHARHKEFTDYATMPVGDSEKYCLKLETSLINFIRPKYNKADSEITFKNLHYLTGFVPEPATVDKFALWHRTKWPKIRAVTVGSIYLFMAGVMALLILIADEIAVRPLTIDESASLWMMLLCSLAMGLVFLIYGEKMTREHRVTELEGMLQ